MRFYTGFLTTAFLFEGIACQDEYYYQYEEPLQMAAGGKGVSENSMDNAWVDLGPDNRKRGDSEEEKGASSPYERVRKLARQSNDWINEYASEYKKKVKLERAVNRFELRYQNALDEDGCRRTPTDEEVRDLNSETRKLPAEPEDKIRKFSKLLGKFHKLYLQDCKKAIRLNEVNERFNRQFMNAYEKISQKKPSGGKYRDNTAFGGDFSETTKPLTTTSSTTTTSTTTSTTSTTTSTTTTTTTNTTTAPKITTIKPTEKPPKSKKPKREKKKKTQNVDKFSLRK